MKSQNILLILVIVLAVTFAGMTATKPLNTVAASNDISPQAVDLVRLVNTAEARSHLAGSKYVPFSELSSTGLLQGTVKSNPDQFSAVYDKLNLQSQTEPLGNFDFSMVINSDGRTYKLSLSEKTRCGQVFFTDEKGLIYQGKAIGCPVS